MMFTKALIVSSFLLLLVFLFDVTNGAKGGGRGFGGGSRGGGSRGASGGKGIYGGSKIGSRPSYGSGYSSGTRRWTQVAAGLFAFNLMSRAASNRHHGYYHGNTYYQNSHRSKGSYCTNLENFNGTVFGNFQCPMEGFPSNYLYCCGPTDYQYCCTYFDDSTRIIGVVAAIIACFLFVICIVGLIVKKKKNSKGNIFKSFRSSFNTTNQYRQPPPPAMPNRNPYQMPPPPTRPPQGPYYGGVSQGPVYPNNFPKPATTNMPHQYPTATAQPIPVYHPVNEYLAQKAESNNTQLPYPTNTPAMPQPMLSSIANAPPPPYSDVVSNPNRGENEKLLPKPNN